VDVVVRRPADLHPLARARRINAATPPAWALLLDVARQEMRDVLPGDIPAVSWFSAESGIDSALPARIGPRDWVAVTTPRLRQRAVSAGLPPDRLRLAPPVALYHPTEPLSMPDRLIDVALIADLAPTDPAHYGFHLESHVRLWNAAAQSIKGRIESFTAAQGRGLFEQAETKTGVRIADADVRAAMIDALSHGAADTMAWLFIAQTLALHQSRRKAGQPLNVAIRGRGWGELGRPCQGIAEAVEVLRSSKLVIHCAVAGGVTTGAIESATSGAALLVRAHPDQDQPGGVNDVFSPGAFESFKTARELTDKMTRLLSDEPGRTDMATRAREWCLAHHTPATRLQQFRALFP
jgi:hypothetical protein